MPKGWLHIEAYETEHYPMDPPDPIEAIKFRMEQQELTRLHDKLGISAQILIRSIRVTPNQ